MDKTTVRRLRFGNLELDLERQELRRDGVLLKLQSQPLKLLAHLALRSDAIVSRDEIRRTVWDPQTHVDFDPSINTCIRQIRQALGDSADHPRYLQTVSRRGYRFLAPVEVVTAVDGSTTAEPGPARRRFATRPLVAAAAVAGLLSVGLLVEWGLEEGRSASQDGRPVVVILPFENLSASADHDYLGDALTEELIAQLGRRYSQRLLVIARTSAMKYKSARKGVGEIADELGADFLLEGSVRHADDRVRVTAQLIRAADESHMWASNYDRDLDDPLAVQVELCDLIADALALKLLPIDVPNAPTVGTTAEAYDVYLRASSLLAQAADRDSLVRAQELFSEVIGLDPGFAPAYARLARAQTLTDNSRESRRAAREALETALALDDGLADAHLSLAMIRFYQDYDVEGARESLERAIEINPGYAEAHQALAAYFSVTGRHDEAIGAVQQARRIDPLSSMVGSDVGWYYYFARRFDEAIEHSERTLELDPGFYWAELCIQLSLLQKRDWPRLIERGREQILRVEPAAAELASLDGGDEEHARIVWEWRLRRLQHLAGQRWIAPADLAQLKMALGQQDEALQMLEDSFEGRTGWILPFLVVDPLFDSLRGDPRFDDLVARIAGNGLRASR